VVPAAATVATALEPELSTWDGCLAKLRGRDIGPDDGWRSSIGNSEMGRQGAGVVNGAYCGQI
jgi:hypothetical protein